MLLDNQEPRLQNIIHYISSNCPTFYKCPTRAIGSAFIGLYQFLKIFCILLEKGRKMLCVRFLYQKPPYLYKDISRPVPHTYLFIELNPYVAPSLYIDCFCAKKNSREPNHSTVFHYLLNYKN